MQKATGDWNMVSCKGCGLLVGWTRETPPTYYCITCFDGVAHVPAPPRQAAEKHPGPFMGPDVELARACAKIAVSDYGDDTGEAFDRIMAGDIWNDHVAVQAALSAIYSLRGMKNALVLAYQELKQHDADYHYKTSVEVNNKIVDMLGPELSSLQPKKSP